MKRGRKCLIEGEGGKGEENKTRVRSEDSKDT